MSLDPCTSTMRLACCHDLKACMCVLVHCGEWQHHCYALSCVLRCAWHPSTYFHAEVSKAPVIACPASMTLTEGDTVTTGSGPISATDPNAGDSAEITCTSSGSLVGDFSGLAVGSHTVTCTATDSKGLSNSCDIAVTVESGALASLKLPSQCTHTCHASDLPQRAAAKAHMVKQTNVPSVSVPSHDPTSHSESPQGPKGLHVQLTKCCGIKCIMPPTHCNNSRRRPASFHTLRQSLAGRCNTSNEQTQTFNCSAGRMSLSCLTHQTAGTLYCNDFSNSQHCLQQSCARLRPPVAAEVRHNFPAATMHES
jgi:hypothetical protein